MATQPSKRAWLRLFRELLAYAVVYGGNNLTQLLGGAGVPFWAVPIIAHVLNSIAKYLREKYSIKLPV